MKKLPFILATTIFACTALAGEATVEDWKKEALRLYPSLGVSGSELNLRFLELVAKANADNPEVFALAHWPAVLAFKADKELAQQAANNELAMGTAAQRNAQAWAQWQANVDRTRKEWLDREREWAQRQALAPTPERTATQQYPQGRTRSVGEAMMHPHGARAGWRRFTAVL